jgi:hypothetical protein
MSNKVDPILGEYRQDDGTGKVPYTGATGDVDLGSYKFTVGSTYQAILGDATNAKAGYFSDGANYVNLCYNSQALDVYGQLALAGDFYQISGNGMYLNNNGSLGGGFLEVTSNGTGAIYATDGSNSVTLCNGFYAVDAQSSGINCNTLTAGYYVSAYNAYFNDGTYTVNIGEGGYGIQATDGTKTVYIVDGTYALSVTGDSYFNDVNGGGGQMWVGSAVTPNAWLWELDDYAGCYFRFGYGSNAMELNADAGGALATSRGGFGSGNTVVLSNQLYSVEADGPCVFGDGGSTNYTKFDDTGHQTMEGTAQPWDDLRVEPTVRAAAEAGVPAFEKYFDDSAGTSKGVWLYSFTDESVAGNEKEIFFTAQLPHSWNSGQIKIHVHFTPAATVNSSDIIWGLEYCWKEPGATFGDTVIVTSSTTLVPDDANITAGKHYIATFSGITPDSTQDDLSSILICRLFRNSSAAGDTYTNKVGLLYVDIHYQMARLGSNDEYTA